MNYTFVVVDLITVTSAAMVPPVLHNRLAAKRRVRLAEERRQAREKDMRDFRARQVRLFDMAMEELDREEDFEAELRGTRREIRP